MVTHYHHSYFALSQSLS